MTNNHNQDLDMSDVLADADRQFGMFLAWLGEQTENDDDRLLSMRYLYGNTARQGDPHSVLVLQVIDFTRARNHITSCPDLEDALYGEDPYDPSMDYPDYDPQTAHYERFGRPVFPNEY